MTDDPVVIDASVLAQVYVRDEDERFMAEAAEIVRRHVVGSLELIAPHFILYEIPSAIQRAVRRSRLEPDIGRQAIRDFFALGIRTLGDERTLPSMIDAAYSRARQVGCHLYDALYLVVAEALGYRFVTADRKLYDATRDRLNYVVWISDYDLEAAP